jgi:hypothetical protein
LLEQVIKNQQVIEQRIVGCKFGRPSTNLPLAAPATAIKGNNYYNTPNFQIPADTRLPILSLNAGGKNAIAPENSHLVQKRDAVDGFYFSNANEAFPSVLDKFPYEQPSESENFYFVGDQNSNIYDNFPSNLDKFPYEEDKLPEDGAINFPNDRR